MFTIEPTITVDPNPSRLFGESTHFGRPNYVPPSAIDQMMEEDRERVGGLRLACALTLSIAIVLVVAVIVVAGWIF